MKKTSKKTPTEGQPTKYLTSTPPNGQGHQKQEKSKTSHSQEEPRGMGQ